MCYPCTQCGRCGKFNEDSPLYAPPPTIPCLKCGGDVDPRTGACIECGHGAFKPAGKTDGNDAIVDGGAFRGK